MRTRKLGLAALVATLGAAGTASAQLGNAAAAKGDRGLALQQFDPAPSGDHFFQVPDASVGAKPSVTLLFNYAHQPLKLKVDGTEKAKPVKSQMYGHLDASYGIANRFLLFVDVPFALAQSGDANAAGEKVKGGKLADVRGGFRLAAFGKPEAGPYNGFNLALQTDVWVPTGKEVDGTGDGQVRINPKIVIGGESAGFVYAGNVGYLIRKKKDLGSSAEIGHALTFGFAAGVKVGENLQIGPEVYGNTVIGTSDDVLGTGGAVKGIGEAKFLGTHSSPIEAILGAKARVGDIVLGGGVGPGLTKTPGVGQFRAVASIALVPKIEIGPGDKDKDGITDDKDACPDVAGVASSDPKKNGCPAPKDRDGDGVVDAQDACPDTPGVASSDPAKNGCPADRDSDGVVDAVDACPDTPGQADADPKKNGCPADKDGDGIPDAQDACVDVAGVKSDDPKKNGCPPDKDGDGVLDKDDACPDVAGVASTDPKKNGCPALAKLEGKEIKIMEQVFFETGKSVIKPESDKLLGEVAAILKEHPEVQKLRIEGHTDNKGTKFGNQALSQARANAVQKWLATKGGVDAKRLEAKGFGQDKPIADNGTEDGRARNRRVEFHISKESTDAAPAPAKAPAQAPPAVGKKK
ncbi:MAG: OmpA family protein [Polyangiaceae bacterium]|nr:OmpA family protein [Polyangiaceae bacterium]